MIRFLAWGINKLRRGCQAPAGNNHFVFMGQLVIESGALGR